jgi:tetratricopeptide (TPR) repeat protein
LVRAGEERTLRARHADHACAVVQQAAAEWERRPSRDWGAAYGGLLGDLRAALAWAGAEPGQVTLQIGLTTAGTVLWNHFSLTDESRTHLAQAIAGLGAAGVIGTKVEMHLQFALAGAILYTRGMTGQARDAVYRALALSEHLGDTDFRLRCLRLAATFELFSGQHDAGIRTLDAFFAIASAEDPTAMAEGETHQCVGAMFIGRVPNARTRMERLAERAAQDFNDARFARFQYSNSINMLVVLSHAQWLTGQAGRAAQTAGTIDAYGRAADHELSLSIALAWNSLLYFWLGRADDCSHHAMLLDELVERHGIVTWRPIATFCRGALAVLRQPDSADGLADLERAIVQFRATGHLARLPFYLAILADTYGKQGRFEQAGATIDEAVAVAASQNEQWCLPELLRIQSGIATAQGEHAAAESLLVQSIALAQRTGTLAWQLRAAMDLAKLWHVQARTVEARAVLQSACAAFTEDADNAELRAATTLLTALQ